VRRVPGLADAGVAGKAACWRAPWRNADARNARLPPTPNGCGMARRCGRRTCTGGTTMRCGVARPGMAGWRSAP